MDIQLYVVYDWEWQARIHIIVFVFTICSCTDITEKEKDKKEGEAVLSTSLETDLTEVLNAWYSAGFYTGK